MKATRQECPSDDVVVLVPGHEDGLGECIIRRTPEKVKLGEQVYLRYQIIKPEGYEKEEILQPLGQGTAGLLSTVFITLALGGSRAGKISPIPGNKT